jgi:hypothetical protein
LPASNPDRRAHFQVPEPVDPLCRPAAVAALADDPSVFAEEGLGQQAVELSATIAVKGHGYYVLPVRSIADLRRVLDPDIVLRNGRVSESFQAGARLPDQRTEVGDETFRKLRPDHVNIRGGVEAAGHHERGHSALNGLLGEEMSILRLETDLEVESRRPPFIGEIARFDADRDLFPRRLIPADPCRAFEGSEDVVRGIAQEYPGHGSPRLFDLDSKNRIVGKSGRGRENDPEQVIFQCPAQDLDGGVGKPVAAVVVDIGDNDVRAARVRRRLFSEERALEGWSRKRAQNNDDENDLQERMSLNPVAAAYHGSKLT